MPPVTYTMQLFQVNKKGQRVWGGGGEIRPAGVVPTVGNNDGVEHNQPSKFKQVLQFSLRNLHISLDFYNEKFQ